MPPTREYPVASIEVYDVGHGQPFITNHGASTFDVIQNSVGKGDLEYGPEGRSNLEVIRGIGLTCRPKLVLQDTRLSHYTFSGGGWAELQTLGNGRRVYRVQQYDTTPGLLWSATTSLEMPENPHFAFELVLPEVPADWNYTAVAPWVRVEFGGYAIQFDRQGNGVFLCGWTGGSWVAIASLNCRVRAGGGDNLDSVMCWVRCLRGKIGISFDYGRSYDWYPDTQDPNARITVPASRLTVRGQGGAIVWGLHQLDYRQGWFDGAPWNTFNTTILSPTVTPHGEALYGSSVVVGDTGNVATNTGRFRAVLTPVTIGHWPWDFKYPPVLAAATTRYPTQRTLLGTTTTTPWDQWISEVTISKPAVLSQGTATIEFEKDAWSSFSMDLRWRKMRVKLGYEMSDGSVEWVVAFTGFSRQPSLSWNDFGQVVVRMTLDNVTVQMRRAEWGPRDVVPLGGMTANDIGDYVLISEGLMDESKTDVTYRSWSLENGAGSVPIPFGILEEPNELVKPFEKKWTTLERVFGYYQMEIAADDSGQYFSLPHDYVDPAVSFHYYPNDLVSTDIREQLAELTNQFDAGDMATAVMVLGTTPWGEAAMAWNVDQNAELSTVSGRFSLWREIRSEILQGNPGPGMLMGRANMLAQDAFWPKWEPVAAAPVHTGLRRRQRVAVHGCQGTGIPDGTEYAIWTLQHRFRKQETLSSLRTVAGLRRLT